MRLPELLDGLPLDVVQVNNNHTIDVGDDGLAATLGELEERGIFATGVDAQLLFDIDGTTVATPRLHLGRQQTRPNPPPTTCIPSPLGTLTKTSISPQCSATSTRRAPGGAQVVVVLLHWGFEYEYFTDPHFMILARKMVAAGADVVAGSGPPRGAARRDLRRQRAAGIAGNRHMFGCAATTAFQGWPPSCPAWATLAR